MGDEVFTTYDLVSHGGNNGECNSEWNATKATGWGPAFQYSCIHSDSNEYSGGDTVWYNYPIASAGTIISENTTSENPANNTTPATESICPKGWTLPNYAQGRGMVGSTYISNFSPVLGGRYTNGSITYKDSRGSWWVREAYSGAERWYLGYDGSTLSMDGYPRRTGQYVRCVVKKNTKTLSNLTYMQDMTPQTSFWTLVNGRSYDEV